ncbi:MAG: glycosyltransferase [candidate division WOR-3 bacterium]
MKIVYLTFNNPLRCYGVYKKEIDLCKVLYEKCLQKNLSFYGLCVVSEKEVFVEDFDYFKIIKYDKNNIFLKLFKKIPIIRSIINYIIIKKLSLEEINRIKPDIIFYRYIWTCLVFNIKKLKKYNKNIIFVTYHQTKEEEEYKVRSKFIYISEHFNFKIMSKYIDGIVGVTSEIVDYELKRSSSYKPNYVLTNGIIVKNYPLVKYKDFNNKLNIIIAVNNNNIWHGIDRIIYGLKDYYTSKKENIEVILHVVGNLSNDIIELVKKLRLENKVIFYGFKYGEELNKIFDECQLGVGSLGLHRIKFRYGSPIKVREYLARGLPCIIGFIDEDIDEQCEFVLNVPADDTPINIEKLVYFVKNLYNKYGQDLNKEIRTYAFKKIDYSVKMDGLINFLENIYNQKRKF